MVAVWVYEPDGRPLLKNAIMASTMQKTHPLMVLSLTIPSECLWI